MNLTILPLVHRPNLATHLLELLNTSDPVVQISDPALSASTDLTSINHEEQNAGYQAAYTKLAASESASLDPVAYVQDPVQFVKTTLLAASQRDPRIQAQLGVVGSGTGLLAQLMG